jgi:hypothetical protein
MAPNHLWQVDVTPDFSKPDNATPVKLQWCGSGKRANLFTLERLAELRWGRSGAELLILNEPTSGSRKILLYNVSGKALRQLPVDTEIRAEFQRSLGANRKIVFYIPTRASWIGSTLVLAVGGTSIEGNVGRTKSHCIGVRVDTRSGYVLNTMPASQLARVYRARCRVSP